MNWTKHVTANRTSYTATVPEGLIKIKLHKTHGGAMVWRAWYPDDRYSSHLTPEDAQAHVAERYDTKENK